MQATIEISYCPKCGWLLRATWMSQELLTTFSEELASLTLKPASNGTFVIRANGHVIWDRHQNQGFPELAELKRRVRDVIAPDRDLGHLDRARQVKSS